MLSYGVTLLSYTVEIVESPPHPNKRTLARHQPPARAAHAARTRRHTHRGRTTNGEQSAEAPHRRAMHSMWTEYKQGGVVAPSGASAQ